MTDEMSEVTQSDLSLARILRESITVWLCTHSSQSFADEARRRLNRIAAEASAFRNLPRTADSLFRKVRGFLISIARDAIVLFGCEKSERIRQCEGKLARYCFSIHRARAIDAGVPMAGAAIRQGG